MMDMWINIWTVVFALTLLVFAGLVIVIAIGGWSDIKAMFATLESQEKSDGKPEK